MFFCGVCDACFSHFEFIAIFVFCLKRFWNVFWVTSLEALFDTFVERFCSVSASFFWHLKRFWNVYARFWSVLGAFPARSGRIWVRLERVSGVIRARLWKRLGRVSGAFLERFGNQFYNLFEVFECESQVVILVSLDFVQFVFNFKL